MTRRSGIAEQTALSDYSASKRFEPTALSDVLDALAALNEQLLDALASSAREAQAEFPLAQSLRSQFVILTSEQRRQAAQCGVLLIDAGFSDLARWRDLVNDSESAWPTDDALDGPSSEQSVVLAYAVLMVAWYVVHTSPAFAGVLLGMTEPVVEIYRELGVGDLAHVARHRAHWVRPRWHDRPDIWSSVVGFATTQSNHQEPMSVILRCLKVSAARSPHVLASVEDAP